MYSRDWDKWLDPLLFAVWEAPKASIGFSHLLFSRQHRAALDLITETGRRVQAAVKRVLIRYLREKLNEADVTG